MCHWWLEHHALSVHSHRTSLISWKTRLLVLPDPSLPKRKQNNPSFNTHISFLSFEQTRFYLRFSNSALKTKSLLRQKYQYSWNIPSMLSHLPGPGSEAGGYSWPVGCGRKRSVFFFGRSVAQSMHDDAPGLSFFAVVTEKLRGFSWSASHMLVTLHQQASLGVRGAEPHGPTLEIEHKWGRKFPGYKPLRFLGDCCWSLAWPILTHCRRIGETSQEDTVNRAIFCGPFSSADSHLCEPTESLCFPCYFRGSLAV